MEPTLFISNSSKLRGGWLIAGLMWSVFGGLMWLFGDAVSAWAADVWGQQVFNISQGKVIDAYQFFHCIGRDIVIVSGALLASGYLLARLLPVICFKGRVALILVVPNILLFVVEQTLLYWTVMQAFPLTDGNFFGRYRFKETLYEMSSDQTMSVVITGSSQPRAQMDENLLNELLPEGVHVSELCFPGMCMYDLPFVYQRLRRNPPEMLILYLSERDAFATPQVGRTLHFVQTPFLIPVLSTAEFTQKEKFYVFLSWLSPVYRERQFIAERLLGGRWNHSLSLRKGSPTEETRVTPRLVDLYRGEQIPEWNRWGLSTLAKNTAEDGTHLFVIRGMMHPSINDELVKEDRDSLDLFLQKLALQKNVTLYDHRSDFPQRSEDYVDWTHISEAAQERFTRHLAVKLTPSLQHIPLEGP